MQLKLQLGTRVMPRANKLNFVLPDMATLPWLALRLMHAGSAVQWWCHHGVEPAVVPVHSRETVSCLLAWSQNSTRGWKLSLKMQSPQPVRPPRLARIGSCHVGQGIIRSRPARLSGRQTTQRAPLRGLWVMRDSGGGHKMADPVE